MTLQDYPFQISYGAADDRLTSFYIPALERSVLYERSAGFFSSSALAVAAAGVARLIKNGGCMRLLVGAKLSEADVDAILRGHDLAATVSKRMLEMFHNPEDALIRQRLEVMAWMVADGTLDIRVVLPVDDKGDPFSADNSYDYYHTKEGLFTDASGNQIAFSGSINESEQAWVHNYEQFFVYQSWDNTKPFLAQVAIRFRKLWENTESDWRSFPLPDAVRERLLSYRPLYPPPHHDSLERKPKQVKENEASYGVEPVPQKQTPPDPEQTIITFVRDAPYLMGAYRLGAATSAITPFPHQHRVADAIVQNFPERFLIADEVGLGKTIETGLVLRQLLISERVKRCLILAPRSVLRQWQEELYEKFALNIPRYDGYKFYDFFNQELPITSDNPFESQPVLLVSSQLVKRKERQEQVINTATLWDLVIVDEAHHARRRDFLDTKRYRPNRLLELLMKLKDATHGMLLLTATPMQVDPIEVWDLLRVLGLGGKWGANKDNFIRFFTELRQGRQDTSNTDWDFLFDMVYDFFANGGKEDQQIAQVGQQELGPVDWHQIQHLAESRKRMQIIKSLSPKAKTIALEYIRKHTPLRRFIFRNTRTLLRQYRQKGILKATVPYRDPTNHWVSMPPDERSLYERIEEYITEFYARYEKERKGLGFIMTIYRRRLTSSFAAIRQSLDRRLAYLKGITPTLTFDDDDIEQDELELDIDDEDGVTQRKVLHREEITYVENFLHELAQLGSDSKQTQLLEQLRAIFQQRDTVVIFTQYTDTMDYLRGQLVQGYGSQVACYSGRGGEVWKDEQWQKVAKETIKTQFRDGTAIKILLCTEAASEGLNLQTCGVLINYDMPWNPMRVEQRIGRIDRIGQHYERVWVHNYFYEDTIEAIIYQRLSNRIDWFETVVGDLQPILMKVSQSIQTLAMLPGEQRRKQLEQQLADIQQELEQQQANVFHLDEYTSAEPYEEKGAVPLTLSNIEHILTTTPSLRQRFQYHPTISHAYFLSWQDKLIPVTFNPTTFDEHATLASMQLLTYGNALFNELLNTLSWETKSSSDMHKQGIVRCICEKPMRVCSYYTMDDTRLVAIPTVEALTQLPPDISWDDTQICQAEESFRNEATALLQRMQTIFTARKRAECLALEAKAQEILLHTALVDIQLGQQLGWWEDEKCPKSYSPDAITQLRRHGYPFKPLLQLVDVSRLNPEATHPYAISIQGNNPEWLKRERGRLKEQVEKEHLVKVLADLKKSLDSGESGSVVADIRSMVMDVPVFPNG